jgi:hypothetical protein
MFARGFEHGIAEKRRSAQSLSQAPEASKPRALHRTIYQPRQHFEQANDLAWSGRHCVQTTPRDGLRRRFGRAERTKNGQSSRADDGSGGPNALDRENMNAQICVRSGQISRGRLCVPRQWQCHQNTGSRVRRTPPHGSWDCKRSLAAAACRGLLS